jgi:hypothetical protein
MSEVNDETRRHQEPKMNNKDVKKIIGDARILLCATVLIDGFSKPFEMARKNVLKRMAELYPKLGPKVTVIRSRK